MLVRKTAVILLIISSFIGVFSCMESALAETYVRIDRPELRGAVLLVDDLLDIGEPQVILGRQNSVYVAHDDVVKELVSDLPGSVTALAAGDLTGDFRPELLVGTDNAGAFYIYERQGDSWRRSGRARYLWEPVQMLAVHDINDDGWGDVLVLNGKGDAEIYLSWEGELYRFWRAANINHFTAADIDGDGVVEILFTSRQGQVAVLKWDEQQLVTIWENYPWGTIESLVVIDEGSRPEWIVVTSQKMLYGWRWQNDTVVTTRHFHAPELGELLSYVPGNGLLSFSPSRGASMFTLGSSSVKELWNVPDVTGEQVYPFFESYLVRDTSNEYFLLQPSDGRWKVLLGEQDITEEITLRTADGQFFAELTSAAQGLGLSLFGREPWYIIGSNGFVSINVGERFTERDNLRFPLSAAAFVDGDDLFVPIDIFNYLGWTVEVDRARQQIRFTQRWGWWY